MRTSGAITSILLGAAIIVGGSLGVSDHLAATARTDRLTSQLHALQRERTSLTDQVSSISTERDRWQGCAADWKQVGGDETKVMSTLLDALQSMKDAGTDELAGLYYSATAEVEAATSSINDADSQVQSITAELPTGCDPGAGS